MESGSCVGALKTRGGAPVQQRLEVCKTSALRPTASLHTAVTVPLLVPIPIIQKFR